MLLNRNLPPTFADNTLYGMNYRVNLGTDGVTFIVSRDNVVKPLEKLGKQRLMERPPEAVLQTIYNAKLDYNIGDRVLLGRCYHDDRMIPSTQSY